MTRLGSKICKFRVLPGEEVDVRPDLHAVPHIPDTTSAVAILYTRACCVLFLSRGR